MTRPQLRPSLLRRATHLSPRIVASTTVFIAVAAVVGCAPRTPTEVQLPATPHEATAKPKLPKPVVENGVLTVTWPATATDSPESLARVIAGLVVEMAATTAKDVHSIRVDINVLDAGASWVMIGFLSANLVEARDMLDDKASLQETLQDRFAVEIRRMPGAVSLALARR